MEKICTQLDKLWTQSGNSNILFTWISFLSDEIFSYLEIDPSKSIEIEEQFSLKESSQPRAVRLPCSANFLNKYNSDEEDAKFFKAYHQCDVCLSEKLGSECFRFPNCCHIYCNHCMKTYFETQIADGNVKRFKNL